MEDISTLTRNPSRGGPGTPGLVPALTLISHPRSERIGERVLLRELEAGREAVISRTEPLFARLGAVVGLPLADPFLSRKPLRLLPREQGGVRIVAGGVPRSSSRASRSRESASWIPRRW